MEDIMRELEAAFDEVKDKDTVYEGLPDGEYLAEIEDIIVGESKMGKPMVTILFEVSHGKYKGSKHRKFLLLSGNDEKQLRSNLHRYATEIKKLGISTSDGLTATFAQLPDACGMTAKLTISTTLSKNGKTYTNTSFEIV